MRTAAKARLAVYQQRVEAALQARLGAPRGHSQLQLHKAIHYSVFSGGKRIRAALVYAAGELGGDAGAATNADTAADLDLLACLVEMVHTYSLIHDDLPAMDNADERRGKASCHRAFGEAQAILAGDALQAMAFGLLAGLRAERHLREILRVLGLALGTEGMVAGQALELQCAEERCDEDLLKRIHWMKTGALIQASLLLGGIAAGLDEPRMQTLARAGEHLGLGFQIVDDVQDWREEGGEPMNYVSVLGRKETLKRSEDLHARALDELRTLPNSDALCELAEMLRDRWSWE